MQDKYNLFYAWVIGQKPEISDPTNPFQCMDLAYELAFFLNFPKDTLSHQYAKDVYLKPNADTRDFFDFIPNSASFIPQALDLAVFDATSNNIAGHISVCNGVGTTVSFQSLDENWTSNGIVTVITHNYTNPKLLGVLRPKIKNNEITDQTKIPSIDNKEVQQIKSEMLAKDSEITSLRLTVVALNASITDLQAKLDNSPVVTVPAPVTSSGSSTVETSKPTLSQLLSGWFKKLGL